MALYYIVGMTKKMTLKTYLHLKEMSISTFASKIGYTRQHITNLCNEKFIPTSHLKIMIQLATDGQVIL